MKNASFWRRDWLVGLLVSVVLLLAAGGRPAFPVDSFCDVPSGKIPASKYRDKIVLIGASAAGVGTLQVTPIAASMPSVVTLVYTVSSILNGDYFLARVADALDDAHRQNVVHRDITNPATSCTTPGTDTVKVADFGIARITDLSKTRTGMVMGALSCMSSEQLARHKVSGASDRFSLGACSTSWPAGVCLLTAIPWPSGCTASPTRQRWTS